MRRPLYTPAAVLAAVSALLIAAEDPGKAGRDGDDLRGIWATVQRRAGGVLLPEDPTAGPLMTAFDHGSYLQHQGERIVEEGTYEIDANQSPATIDLQIRKGPDAGKRQLGIFAVEGDELKLCLSGPGTRKRPRDFEPKTGTATLLVVCRRFRP
jgi:uncharacterized protein (TIGR03067 family)